MVFPEKGVVALGLVAGVLTTLSFVPQVTRIWKTHSADDISAPMFLIFSFGTLLWLFYGLLSHSLPVTIANSVTLIFSISILSLKWKWRARTSVPGAGGR